MPGTSIPRRGQFKFRFSPHKLRDIHLSQWVAADMEAGINVSEIAKDLLYAYYLQRQNSSTFLPAGLPSLMLPAAAEPVEEPIDARDDPLVQKMRGLSSSFSAASFAGK